MEALASFGATSFDGELVALDAQGRPSFQLIKTIFRSRFRSIVTSLIYCTRMANCLSNCLFCVVANCLRVCLPRLRIRSACRRCCRRQLEKILEAVRKLGLEGVVGKRLDSRYAPGERSGPGSSSARTWSRSSSSAVTFQARADLMRCSSVFTRTRNSSSSPR